MTIYVLYRNETCTSGDLVPTVIATATEKVIADRWASIEGQTYEAFQSAFEPVKASGLAALMFLASERKKAQRA
jgi:hypothetical protein